jgi:hypothetical protein
MPRLLILGIVAMLLAAGCDRAGGGSQAAVQHYAPTEVRLMFGGFSLAVPAGWHTGVSRNDDGSAYLTAASSDVDEHEGALGIGSQSGMQPEDVLISIAEIQNPPDPSGFQPLTGTPQVSRNQLGQYAVPAPAMSVEAYTASGRYFQVGVAFGRVRPTNAQLRTANQVLSSFAVEPR